MQSEFVEERQFLTGDIERLGTGTLDMFELSLGQSLQEPLCLTSQGVRLTIWRTADVNTIDTHQDTHQDELNKVEQLLLVFSGECTRSELVKSLHFKDQVYFRESFLSPALYEKYIAMTIPDKPNSKHQKYKLTRKGVILRNKLIKSKTK